MAPKFDANDVTSKIDFSAPIGTSALEGASVLITGGAGGLGTAITWRLCAEGAHVTIADFMPEAGEKLVEELRNRGYKAIFVKTDVTSWASQVEAFKTAIKQSPNHRLDLVIPCAGTPGIPLPIHPTVTLDEDPPAPSTMTIDVTLTGYVEVPPVADYTASKFGVRGLWKTIQREVRDMGIRTNMIAPTFVKTMMIAQIADKLEEAGAKLGTVEAIADAALRLACNDDIDGRAVASGWNGNFDLRDDYEGLDGGIETLAYFKTEGFGGGMRYFKDILGGRTW